MTKSICVLLAVMMWLVACDAALTPTPAPVPTVATTPTAAATPTLAPYPPPRSTPEPYTPPPTSTPAPTVTPTPTTIIKPPINAATSVELKRIDHDFMFLSDRQFIRWNHVTSRMESLVTGVKAYSASENGQRLAVTRNYSADEDEIEWVNMQTRQATPIARMPRDDTPTETDRPAPGLPAISPDGKWIAYAKPVALPSLSPGQTTSATITSTIYAVQLDPPHQRVIIGDCTAGRTGFTTSTSGEGADCLELLWSRDSRSIAWSDFLGLWFATPGQAPHLLAAHRYGKATSIWHLVEWVGGARFLLGEVRKYEWREWGIANPIATQVIEVPAPAGIGSNGDATWMQDGRLFVLGNERLGDNPAFSANLWRVSTTNGLTLAHELSFTINLSGTSFPSTPRQFTTGHLGLTITNLDRTDASERGLFEVDFANRQLHKLTGLPPRPPSGGPVEVFWSPDGKAAIVQGLDTGDRLNSTPSLAEPKRSTLYIPTDSSPLIDLTPLVGYDACCFTWIK